MKRSYEKELIDLGSQFYTLEEYHDCLKHLGRVGKLLGGNRAALKAFDRLKVKPSSILDVGCGGGDFTRLLAKKYPKAKILGIDFSKEAIAYANKHPNNLRFPHLKFEATKKLELEAPLKSYDLITATLVCHHMNDVELIDFLKRAKSISRHSMIINDLHRSYLAYYSFFFLSPLLFPNRLIHHDGLISIKRGFTRSDWISYLEKAGFKKNQYTIQWKFPFRWIITITL